MVSEQQFQETLYQHIHRYTTLSLGKTQSVRAPYYMNTIQSFWSDMMRKAGIPNKLRQRALNYYRNNEVPYGWFRGKGKPEELVRATKEIAEQMGFDIKNATAYGVREFMKHVGIGIDCSGFIYNVLEDSLAEITKQTDYLEKKLHWDNPLHKGVTQASVRQLTQKQHSQTISSFTNLRSGDLIARKDTHILLVFSNNGETIVCYHAGLKTKPTGVSRVIISIRNPESSLAQQKFTPKQEFDHPWSEPLSMHRLNVISDLINFG